MRSRLLLGALAVAILVAFPATSPAATTKRAEKAVRNVLSEHVGVHPSTAQCGRLTARRWLCTWTGAKAALGHSCYGTAKVTEYRYAFSVTITRGNAC